MSYRVLKAISVDLSTKGLTTAIREVNLFRTELELKCLELVQALMMEGAEVAKMQVVSMDAVYTGELEGSIQGLFMPSEKCGFVIADTPYAIYVEYGTGGVGGGSIEYGTGAVSTKPIADQSHPVAKGNWDYDVNGHSVEGWVYRNDKDGKFYWTRGFIARPFMYNTLRWLEEAAPEKASEIF